MSLLIYFTSIYATKVTYNHFICIADMIYNGMLLYISSQLYLDSFKLSTADVNHSENNKQYTLGLELLVYFFRLRSWMEKC